MTRAKLKSPLLAGINRQESVSYTHLDVYKRQGVGETGMFAQEDAGIVGAAVSLHRGHVF